MNEVLEYPALTALDRCDACSAAAAQVRVVLTSGELIFCNHCFNRHSAALEPGAMIING